MEGMKRDMERIGEHYETFSTGSRYPKAWFYGLLSFITAIWVLWLIFFTIGMGGAAACTGSLYAA